MTERVLYASQTSQAWIESNGAVISRVDTHPLCRARVAVGMMYVSVTPTISLFGGLGRTISKLDQNGAPPIASTGVRIETTRHAKP